MRVLVTWEDADRGHCMVDGTGGITNWILTSTVVPGLLKRRRH